MTLTPEEVAAILAEMDRTGNHDPVVLSLIEALESSWAEQRQTQMVVDWHRERAERAEATARMHFEDWERERERAERAEAENFAATAYAAQLQAALDRVQARANTFTENNVLRETILAALDGDE